MNSRWTVTTKSDFPRDSSRTIEIRRPKIYMRRGQLHWCELGSLYVFFEFSTKEDFFLSFGYVCRVRVAKMYEHRQTVINSIWIIDKQWSRKRFFTWFKLSDRDPTARDLPAMWPAPLVRAWLAFRYIEMRCCPDSWNLHVTVEDIDAMLSWFI
jgi:hypothetical protein